MNKPVPPSPIPADPLAVAAAGWLAQREEGFTTAQSAEFARWQAADARHAAAVARLDATCNLLRKLPLLRDDARFQAQVAAATRQPRKIVQFPRLARVAVGLAAALVLAGGLWWSQQAYFGQTYTTTAGGYERVTLPDGSVLELNASSRVRVRFRPDERQVALLEGEAHFTVAKNKERPFVVTAGQLSVRAVGTAFNVRLDPAAVEVLVTEGKVQLARRSSALEPAAVSSSHVVLPLLVAGEAASVSNEQPDLAPRVQKVDLIAQHQMLNWQAPRLVFVDTPLADVVAQFNRRNRLQLVLEDPVLAARPVGGAFQADQVESFVRLLEGSGDISVERMDASRVKLRRR